MDYAAIALNAGAFKPQTMSEMLDHDRALYGLRLALAFGRKHVAVTAVDWAYRVESITLRDCLLATAEAAIKQ